jgi:hypothetical protein
MRLLMRRLNTARTIELEFYDTDVRLPAVVRASFCSCNTDCGSLRELRNYSTFILLRV